jgi:hypothetical protein
MSRSTAKPRIMSCNFSSMTFAIRGANRGRSEIASENRTVFSGHFIAASRNTSAAVKMPRAANAVGIIQSGASGPRRMNSATNTNSEIINPSMIRSTATVPSAAEALIPRRRSNPGRTSSPSRSGSARIAMKPTLEIASSGPAGTWIPSGASR